MGHTGTVKMSESKPDGKEKWEGRMRLLEYAENDLRELGGVRLRYK
jgi:hypothetical protein